MLLFSLAFWRSGSARSRALLAATLACASVVHAQGTGFWHTGGSHILDDQNRQVRIAGINWYGFETAAQVPGGLYNQDYKTILDTVKSQGFNSVRLPLSSEMIESPSTRLNIQYGSSITPINSDLRGLNALEVLDRIVAHCQRIGLKVILDHHRSEAGNTAEANGLWYTATYSEASWIADWVALAARYRDNPTVVGFDLHNEPHSVNQAGACWDCGGARDWHLAAQRAGDAVLRANPKLLIFVEGVDTYNGDGYWWGGNLKGVARSPVVLAIANQLVYSPHDYGPHEAKQAWFNAGTGSRSLAAMWDQHWGYISKQGIAPIWLSEFGTTNDAEDLKDTRPGSQGQWFESLIAYLNTETAMSWNYWALNGEDAYALLDRQDGPLPVSTLKQTMLASIAFPLAPGTADAPATAPSVTISSPAPVARAATAEMTRKEGSNAWRWALIAGSGATFALFARSNTAPTPQPVAATARSPLHLTASEVDDSWYFFNVQTIARDARPMVTVAPPEATPSASLTL